MVQDEELACGRGANGNAGLSEHSTRTTVMMTVSADCTIMVTISYCFILCQACHAVSFSTVVEVNFIISQPITVREGNGVVLRLRGEAFGLYAYPIIIGVICASVDVTTGVATGRGKH